MIIYAKQKKTGYISSSDFLETALYSIEYNLSNRLHTYQIE